MANELKMAERNAILALAARGWSYRRIAKELGVYRGTVSRYVRLAREGSITAPLGGWDDAPSPKPAKVPTGTAWDSSPKPAKLPAGNPGGRSLCEPFRDVIVGKLDLGLSAQRIYQDLVVEHGFEAGYDSVKRFVRPLVAGRPLPFRRMECEPGEEAQIDYGRGAPVVGPDGKRRVPHVLRVVLSHSRKGYSEACFRQTTESFIRQLENAFRSFGGVPRTVVIDNLRAAVSKADWYDPELNPKIEAFCRRYGTAVLPTRPYTPRHKGKVEKGVGYVRDNALKGRVFASLAEENLFLQEWERAVADCRIHGTTRKQVRKVFEADERPALMELPASYFPVFNESRRRVHRDGHVEVDRAYYSVPPEYVGRELWVRWNSRVVRVFNGRFEQIAMHAKTEPGRFGTDPAHIASEKISSVERGAEALLGRAKLLGPHAGRWAEEMLAARGVQGVRVLLGLLALAKRNTSAEIDAACECALTHGAFRLRAVRQLLKRKVEQRRIDFLDEHPLIRPMSEYSRIVRVSFREPGGRC